MKIILILFLTVSPIIKAADNFSCEGEWTWTINQKHMGEFKDKVAIVRTKDKLQDSFLIDSIIYYNEIQKKYDLEKGYENNSYFVETSNEIIFLKWDIYEGRDNNLSRTFSAKLNRITGKLSIKKELAKKDELPTEVRSFNGFCKKTDKLL